MLVVSCVGFLCRSGQYWWMRTTVWFLPGSSEKETILLKFIDFDFTHTHKLSNIIFPDICTWDKEGTAGSGGGDKSVSGEGRVKSSASELPEPPEFISSTYYVVNCSPQPCVQPGILWGEVCGHPQVVLTLSFDSFNFINSIQFDNLNQDLNLFWQLLNVDRVEKQGNHPLWRSFL